MTSAAETADGADTGLAIATEAESPSAHHVRGDYTELRYAEEGPVARITLNRPHVRNALSLRLSDELTNALERVRDSATVRVLVIRGGGTSARATTSPRCRSGAPPTR